MKYKRPKKAYHRLTSLPVRGAWVEIKVSGVTVLDDVSLPVRGAWVEMTRRLQKSGCMRCRSPCGERGLKYGKKLLLAML